MSSSLISTFGPSYKPVQIGDIATIAADQPLILDSGRKIENFPLAYQTYGKLNAEKSNAILIHHGLTGDQYIAGKHPVTGKDGWWEHLVGPGKIIDTNIFFVVCTNVLGGCMGSFGPKNINPETNKPYGLDFPVITIRDMVRAQERFMGILNIKQWLCVMGGSMGGMLTLEWAALYPEKVGSALVIASGARFTAQNIAFHEIGRQAIMADPEWCNGKYLEEQRYPKKGLAVARMTAHLTYMSEDGLQRKFGRALQNREQVTYGFEADFQVESYLRHQGMTFVERFDANSYLYITRAMDYFDLAGEFDGKLANAFNNTKTHFCIISFSSDWLFTTKETKKIVHALNASHARISFVEVQTDKGHDAFLLDEPEFFSTLSSFLSRICEEQNVQK